MYTRICTYSRIRIHDVNGSFRGHGGSIPSTSGVFNFLAVYLKMSGFLICHVIPFQRAREKGFLKLFHCGLTHQYVEMPGRTKNRFVPGRPFVLFRQQTAHLHCKAVHCISSNFLPKLILPKHGTCDGAPNKLFAMGLLLQVHGNRVPLATKVNIGAGLNGAMQTSWYPQHATSTKNRKWPQHMARPQPETSKNGFSNLKTGGGGSGHPTKEWKKAGPVTSLWQFRPL